MGIDLNKHKVLQHGDSLPKEIQCDVCIIGSGAGGGTLAAKLAAAELSVVMVGLVAIRIKRISRWRRTRHFNSSIKIEVFDRLTI